MIDSAISNESAGLDSGSDKIYSEAELFAILEAERALMIPLDVHQVLTDDLICAQKIAAEFEAKFTALLKGVSVDFVDDVILLSSTLVSSNFSVGDAIDSVLVKYPHFKADFSKARSSGVHTPNRSAGNSSDDLRIRRVMGLE